MLLSDQLTQNQTINNINVDNAVADILSNLSYDYILHIVTDSLSMKFRPYSTSMPNMPASLEQHFKMLIDANPSSKEEILQKREEVYHDIIEILCTHYNLDYNPSDDIYADAFYLYNFLISDFTGTVVQFYVNYIVREKQQLYERLDPDESKKKELSVYSKKMYGDPVIAAMHASVIPIISDISTFDISLHNILDYRYVGNPTEKIHLSNIIGDNGYFFNHIRIFATGTYMADLVNCVKLALQSAFGDPAPIGQFGTEV